MGKRPNWLLREREEYGKLECVPKSEKMQPEAPKMRFGDFRNTL